MAVNEMGTGARERRRPVFIAEFRRTSNWCRSGPTNVNGVNVRLPSLLQCLAENTPDIVCLRELKAPE
jgi:hypothetical protein